MFGVAQNHFSNLLDSIREEGLFKEERVIDSAQGTEIDVGGKKVLNFCANNYLGLANNAQLIAAAKKGLEQWGFGLSSVRFICGTQAIHKELEKLISQFLKTEDTILYSSCFDANTGLFETILGEEDAIISDALNHASIIDGIRLCKAKRFRYSHGDLTDLERCLKESQGSKLRLVATDGVFSMDGDIAQLKEIASLCDKYQALLMVDDSHATGFVGPTGRGTGEHCGVMSQIDIVTSTLGKALGGASGGFTSGKREIIELLRQRSRPYLFSNSLPPALVAAGICALELLSSSTALRDTLEKNTLRFRTEMTEAGFQIRSGVHPIVPIMIGDAKLASDVASDLLAQGIYVRGFSFPVVPKGEARIRVQLSAAHTMEQISTAISTFSRVGARYGLMK